MAENKAAVEVKQEGDFKIKLKPKSKKPKQLAIADTEIAKINLSNTTTKDEVAKVDLTKKPETDAVQEHKTEKVDVGERTGDGGKVDEGTRVSDSTKESPEPVKKDSPLEQIIEEVVEPTPKKDNNIQQEEKQETVELPKLPENVDKLVKFMDETGGTVEDYVKLNKNYGDLDDNSLLHEYYKQTKAHLSPDEINFLIEDKFLVDEDVDGDKEMRRKKLAYKEEVAYAKKDLESLKNKYYADIKQRPGVTQEHQKAMDFFDRYNKQQETIESNHEHFKTQTNNLFTNDFKGFDYALGDKKFRYKVQNPDLVADKQININTFVEKYLDKDGKIGDAIGYHKALYAAMNADKLASHFYEQGKADGIKNVVQNSKNPATEAPRQVAGGDVFVAGMKVKAISGSDSSKLKIKKRKFNN